MQQHPHDPDHIRVALVDDDIGFQQAMADALAGAPDMQLVGVASTRAEGMALLERPQVDVLVVDLGLPDGSGIDIIRAAHAAWPGCSIMVSTTFGDEDHVMRSLMAGAAGYLLKDTAPRHMLEEIRNLQRGGSPISPLIARKILTRFRQDYQERPPASDTSAAPRASLSAREQEVLEYITKGFTSNEIAALMQVSHHTVLTFVRRIYAKLEVNSRTEAIFEARLQGLLKG